MKGLELKHAPKLFVASGEACADVISEFVQDYNLFIGDTCKISYLSDTRFISGRMYIILIKYTATISVGNNGVYCATDPDIL